MWNLSPAYNSKRIYLSYKNEKHLVHSKLIKRELDLKMIKYMIVCEYYGAIQNIAFEEYLIICENKF